MKVGTILLGADSLQEELAGRHLLQGELVRQQTLVLRKKDLLGFLEKKSS